MRLSLRLIPNMTPTQKSFTLSVLVFQVQRFYNSTGPELAIVARDNLLLSLNLLVGLSFCRMPWPILKFYVVRGWLWETTDPSSAALASKIRCLLTQSCGPSGPTRLSS